MLRVFICPDCAYVVMKSKFKYVECIKCESPMETADIKFIEYTNLNLKQREEYIRNWIKMKRQKECS